MIGYTPFRFKLKPITLFSKSIFTLIKKNLRNLAVGNNEYTRDECFSKSLWRKYFETRLTSCVIILTSLVCFPCFKSVSYDFHCLILCKQTSNIIIVKILPAIMQYIFIHKNCRGLFLELDIFFSMSSCWCSYLRHAHKLSFRRILVILLRPLSAHALFDNDRFNKDGQKNKRKYIKKSERNACKDYPFHK